MLLVALVLAAARGCDSMTGADDPPSYITGRVLDGTSLPDRVGIEGVTVTELTQEVTTGTLTAGIFQFGRHKGGVLPEPPRVHRRPVELSASSPAGV
jgi:hypothetical protein